MPHADERDDRGGLHEIQVRVLEERPYAVGVGSGGAERNQRVHVGTAHLELLPGATIKARAASELHQRGESESQPLEPTFYRPTENPFTNHEKGRYWNSQRQIQPPAARPM